MSEPCFVCPRCQATSYHPFDVREGYCGRCHDWTAVPPRVWTGIQMGEPPPIFIDTDTVVGDLDSVPLTAEQRAWRNRRSTRRSIRRRHKGKGGVRSGVSHHWWGRWTISFADLPPVMATRFRKSDAELLAAELNAAEADPADRQYQAVKRHPSGP